MSENKVGRPRTIDSPETFDMLVDTYMDMCASANKPVTLTGLILSLGLSCRDSLDTYATYEGFSDSVKRAKLFIENAYEERLVAGTNAAAPIFALKNFGWKDKQDIDANLNHSGSIESIKRVIVDPKTNG